MTWTIVVVDTLPKRWPPIGQLVASGVPVPVAQRYALVRRQMSPAGLKRKLQSVRN